MRKEYYSEQEQTDAAQMLVDAVYQGYFGNWESMSAHRLPAVVPIPGEDDILEHLGWSARDYPRPYPASHENIQTPPRPVYYVGEDESFLRPHYRVDILGRHFATDVKRTQSIGISFVSYVRQVNPDQRAADVDMRIDFDYHVGRYGGSGVGLHIHYFEPADGFAGQRSFEDEIAMRQNMVPLFPTDPMWEVSHSGLLTPEIKREALGASLIVLGMDYGKSDAARLQDLADCADEVAHMLDKQ